MEIWFNPSCSKCRTVEGLLTERAVVARPPERVLELLEYSSDAGAGPVGDRASGTRNGEQKT